MNEARCACGAFTARTEARPRLVVACHCTHCQRRTGAPFGVGAFYPETEVTLDGPSRHYDRIGASGGQVRTRFCPACGTTLCWTADRAPGLIAIAAGAFADPAFPGPDRSIWEQHRSRWVSLDAAEHRPTGSSGQ